MISPELRDRRRILIVDEHSGSRTASCLALCHKGHICKSVDCAAAGLAVFYDFKPHVVMYECHPRAELNVRPSALDGFGRELRRRAAQASLPKLLVIAVSALDEPVGFREREDIDAYVMKPFTVDDLQTILRSLG